MEGEKERKEKKGREEKRKEKHQLTRLFRRRLPELTQVESNSLEFNILYVDGRKTSFCAVFFCLPECWFKREVSGPGTGNSVQASPAATHFSVPKACSPQSLSIHSLFLTPHVTSILKSLFPFFIKD